MRNRIQAIDLVRGISVLLMIPVHAMMIFSDMNTWEHSITGQIIQWVEKGTPMFLVVMGISFAFSRKQNTQTVVKRAVLIIAMGYLLNVLRFLVPLQFFGGFPESFIHLNQMVVNDKANYLLFLGKGDILQLAGISLLIIGVFYALFKQKVVILIVALLMIVFSKALSGITSGIVGVDYLLDLLWGNGYTVYFPLFPWMSFILIGLFFGVWYQKRNSEHIYLLFQPMLFFGVGFMSIGVVLCNYDYAYHFGDYYHLGPGGTLTLMGLNLLFIWVSFFVIKFLPVNNLFFRLCFYCSKNVTSFYCIQWILIYWIMAFLGFSIHKEGTVLLIIAGVIALTFALLLLKNKGMQYVQHRRNKLPQNQLV